MSKSEIKVAGPCEVDNRTSIEHSSSKLAIEVTFMEEQIGALIARIEPLMSSEYPEKAEDKGRPINSAKAVEFLDVQTDRIRGLSNIINSINNRL